MISENYRPQAQRLNCSDPDTVYSAGEALLRSIRRHQLTNQGPVLRSRDLSGPIRGQLGQAITGDISFNLEDDQRNNIELYLIARS